MPHGFRRLDLEIGKQGVIHRNHHEFQEKPKDVKPEGEMSHLADQPGHERAAEGQIQGARADESQGGEEVAAFSYLEPSRSRKRHIGCQKHQCKQSRDNHIERLSDRFCQAFRRLRYQSFCESHGCLSKFAAKIQNLAKSPILSAPPKPSFLQSLSAWRRRPICVSSRRCFPLSRSWLLS